MQHQSENSGHVNDGPAGPAPIEPEVWRGDVPCRQQRSVTQSAHSIEEILGSLSFYETLTEEQFVYFKDIAKRYTGIVIADFKKNMIARRIRTRLKALSVRTIGEYCELLRGPQGKREMQPLINALTTNRTEFFRESHHFDHLGHEALPLLTKSRGGKLHRLRIWSAGCSTGEEPYSIAMTLQSDAMQRGALDYRILATDIDTNVLAHARSGVYRLSDLASLPPSHRAAFLSASRAEPGKYRVSPAIRERVSFQHLNLHHYWPMKGPFDIIFCRNVVIYFDKATQRTLFDRLADILTGDGLLYCGHSESLYGVSSRFRSIGQSIYQRVK